MPPEVFRTVYEKVPSYQEPHQQPLCDCPNPYEGEILTAKQGGLFVGLKRIDCMLWQEILQLKKEIGKPKTGAPNPMENLCKALGWWHEG